MDDLRGYFRDTLATFGLTPQGVDWNSSEAQETRFVQLSRLLPASEPYALIDYGSGFGGMYDFLRARGHRVEYFGYDFLPEMVAGGSELHRDDPACHFTPDVKELPLADYAIASGIFNVRLRIADAAWIDFVIGILDSLHRMARRGFAFNMLTKYSDPERMKAELFYADPCFFFDHCKRHYARNVALLHDYVLYDFTVLVRKERDEAR